MHKMKRSFFQAAGHIDTAILVCTTWDANRRLEKKLDGNYTRMLRAILNKSLAAAPHKTPTVRATCPLSRNLFKSRRTRHAGHCWRSRDELIRDVLLWIPQHGRAKAGTTSTNVHSAAV